MAMAEGAGGDLVLVDSERGTKIEVSVDERAVRAYRRRLEVFLEQLTAYAKQRGLFYQRVGGDIAWGDALISYLRAS